MKMELHFDENVIFESVYDTLCEFFKEKENMEAFLSEETRYDILSELANYIKYIFDDITPDEIDVYHSF